MNELIDRKILDSRGGIWHYYTNSKGEKFSVVDFGKMMETLPDKDLLERMRAHGLFMGWEAMLLSNPNDDIDKKADFELVGDPIRAATWEELEPKLKHE